MSPSYHRPDSLWLVDVDDSVVEVGVVSLLLDGAPVVGPEATRLNEWRLNRLVFLGLVPVVVVAAPGGLEDLDTDDLSSGI